MAKRKKNKIEQIVPVNITLPSNMGLDEMKHIIADGLMEFEERKKQQEKEVKAAYREEWHRAIGLKDFSNVKKPLRWLLQFCNRVKAFFRACVVSRKHIKGDRVTFSLMQIMLYSFLKFCSWGSLLYSVAFLVAAIPALVNENGIIVWSVVARNLFGGALAFSAFGMFRTASFEVDNLEDRNYILMLFTCVTSIIAVVIAIVK